jgi:hypothetical protein
MSVVWSYWDDVDGRVRPPYLDACWATVRRHSDGMELRVVSQATVRDVVEVPPRFDELAVNHRSDVARCRLLLEHGGLWLDADTVALRPLTRLMAMAATEGFVGYGHDGVHPGTIAARAGHPILVDWARRQDRRLRSGRTIDWPDLGPIDLEDATAAGTWHRLDHRRIAPIDWQDWRLFLSRTYPLRNVMAASPEVVALYNAPLSDHLRSWRLEPLIASGMLVGRVLAAGLGRPESGERWRAIAGPAALGARAMRKGVWRQGWRR